jgi:hypothetical protein
MRHGTSGCLHFSRPVALLQSPLLGGSWECLRYETLPERRRPKTRPTARRPERARIRCSTMWALVQE